MPQLTPLGENRLLQQLVGGDLAVLEPALKNFEMVRGAVLHPAGVVIKHVYFPVSGMVSLLAVMKDGDLVETGIVGREGVVGASIGSFGPFAFGQATVQIPGSALRISSDRFMKAYNASRHLRRSVNGFQSVILLQAQQSAACHALHTVESRLCRWLLQSSDVIESDVVELTQEFLSHMLGVQRAAVSLAAGSLQKKDLIEYARGKITLIDRKGLHGHSCECYDVVRAHANRLSAASRT